MCCCASQSTKYVEPNGTRCLGTSWLVSCKIQAVVQCINSLACTHLGLISEIGVGTDTISSSLYPLGYAKSPQAPLGYAQIPTGPIRLRSDPHRPH